MHESTDHDDGFVEIDADECKRLLRDEGVGIVGVTVEGEIELRPVNYGVGRGTIVMRTDRGTLFEAARREEAASLAVMSYDEETRTAWSVIVRGALSSGDAEREGTQLFSWAHSGKAERIRLAIDRISGRRLAPRDPADDA